MRPRMVTIAATEAATMLAAARARAPHELAGLLAGDGPEVAPTIAHWQPFAGGAGGADRFAVAAADFAAAEAAARARGLRWLGFVHSHPRGPAAPSPVDRAELWPRCLQLVIGLGAPGPAFGAFWLDDGTAHLLPLAIRGGP